MEEKIASDGALKNSETFEMDRALHAAFHGKSLPYCGADFFFSRSSYQFLPKVFNTVYMIGNMKGTLVDILMRTDENTAIVRKGTFCVVTLRAASTNTLVSRQYCALAVKAAGTDPLWGINRQKEGQPCIS